MNRKLLWLLLMAFMVWACGRAESSAGGGTIYQGNPSNYCTLLDMLGPGDTLELEAGTYTQGLPLEDMNGNAAAPIIIRGPITGTRARFTWRSCCNTISLRDSSYIEIYNLELDGTGMTDSIDGVKAEGDANWVHHITLENLYIHDHDYTQETVGISTKAPAWDWIIRRNIIEDTGTGMYLGNSTGAAPFVRGLIEYNFVQDTLGYNIQIKHQNPRPNLSGMPPDGSQTIIRHNVFSKANNSATGADARPNLLVGHWPLSGTGMNDHYLIYSNFFYQNPTGEPLFQGEGHLALYDNLFVNRNGGAVWIQPHNDVPRRVEVFNNTVVATATGIRLTGVNPSYSQYAAANAIFAATPLNLDGNVTAYDNVTGSYATAATYLVNPAAAPGNGLDLYPLVGVLSGSPINMTPFQSFSEWDEDFNSHPQPGIFRGAYGGEGTNPGWLPALERKPPPSPPFTPTDFAYLPLAVSR